MKEYFVILKSGERWLVKADRYADLSPFIAFFDSEGTCIVKVATDMIAIYGVKGSVSVG